MAETLQIRTSAEQQELFKELADRHGLTQGAALQVMMEAYQLSEDSLLFPERKDDIEKFQQYSLMLQQLFHLSIEHGAAQKELAQSTVRTELESKDKIIQELQQKVESLTHTANTAIDMERRATQAETELDELRKQRDTLMQINHTLESNAGDHSELLELQKQVAVLQAQLAAKDEVISALKLSMQRQD